jgi:putative hydrolase of the HAD superfamily
MARTDKPLRAIIVDVDGTLYRQRDVRIHVTGALVKAFLAKPLRAWKTMHGLRVYRQVQEELRQSTSFGSAADQLSLTAQKTGYDLPFLQEIVTYWMETMPLPAVRSARFPGVVDFFRWAAGRQLKLGVVSDYNPVRKLRVLELEQYFTTVVCAQDKEVGKFKPHPRGLQVAMERLGVEAGEVVYIGDRVDVDCAAARAAGIEFLLLGTGHKSDGSDVTAAKDWPEIRGVVENSMGYVMNLPTAS